MMFQKYTTWKSWSIIFPFQNRHHLQSSRPAAAVASEDKPAWIRDQVLFPRHVVGRNTGTQILTEKNIFGFNGLVMKHHYLPWYLWEWSVNMHPFVILDSPCKMMKITMNTIHLNPQTLQYQILTLIKYSWCTGPFALCAYINNLSVCHIHVRNYGIPMSLMIRATCTPRISLLQTQPHNVGVFFDTAILLQPMNHQNSGKCTPEEDLRRPGKEMTKLLCICFCGPFLSNLPRVLPSIFNRNLCSWWVTSSMA